MRQILLLCTGLFLYLSAAAQQREEGFDFHFKPTTNAPRYYVVTEKKEGNWNRKAWYLPERGMAMEGWYRDEACNTPHGPFIWYHSNRMIRETGSYADGKKLGTWLRYDEEGHMVDSAAYEGGRRKGIGLGWYPSGMPSDSSYFDGAGKGTEVHWYEEGTLQSAGYIINDTAKDGRWKYYHPNGTLMATEDYKGGERIDCQCFTETGTPLDTAACKEQDAEFVGGQKGWTRFLERNLNPSVPVDKRAPVGTYTVVAQFIVEKDGSINNIKALTHNGFGMEEEVVRMLIKSPKWVPAQQFGKKVRAYRRQPVTFVVQQG
jgi:hypothetical protein